MSEPKIYCWINAGKGTDWVVSMAMAEDGTHLTSHVSSSDGFAKGDCGYLPTGMGLSKRAIFDEHYPDGYEPSWIEIGRAKATNANDAEDKVVDALPTEEQGGPFVTIAARYWNPVSYELKTETKTTRKRK